MSEGEKSEGKLELSFSGLAAGALATITATVLASFFGSYGTLIGAGASSIVSTAGAAIYQHFFRRTGSKLKEAGAHLNSPVLRNTHVFEHAGGVVVTEDPRQAAEPAGKPTGQRSRSDVPAQAARSSRPRTLADVMGETRTAATARLGAEPPNQEAGADDATSAEAAPAQGTETAKASMGAFAERSEGGRTDRAGAFGEPGTTDAANASDATEVADDGTRVLDAAAESGGPAGDGPGDGTADGSNLADTDDAETMAINRMAGVSEVYTTSGGPPERPGFGAMLEWARGRWPKLLIGAVAVFVVVMGAVTGLEAIMDKPLSAAVRGEPAHGLTLDGGGTPATGTPTDRPSGPASPNPTEHSDEPTPGETGAPNPGQTDQQHPGQQTKVPQQPPTTQPTTVPTTQPPASPDDVQNGLDSVDNAQGRQG